MLIPRALTISMTWNIWHFFTLFGSFWYLAFKVTQFFLVEIEVCGKYVRFLNISENTKENLINFPDWYYFGLISRHFISVSRYFRLCKVMPKIREPISNKFKKSFLSFSSKFKKLNFHFEFLCIFLILVFLFGTYLK